MAERMYICRRCSRPTDASPREVEFGRVVCCYCGGTCDPSPTEQARLDAVRSGARDQLRKHERFSAGFGTNKQINRPGLPPGE